MYRFLRIVIVDFYCVVKSLSINYNLYKRGSLDKTQWLVKDILSNSDITKHKKIYAAINYFSIDFGAYKLKKIFIFITI